MSNYRERLSVPVRWWIIAALAVLTILVITAVPAGKPIGFTVAGVAAVILVVLFVRYGGAVVEVGPSTLHAGRATIERTHLGKVEPLTGEAVRNAFGRDCDPTAYLVLRSYLPGAVRVEITDPHDPTPYWLIATRSPERLAAALTENSVARS
ncbi:hypothetical protein Kfla_3768 [Kribbella flavida DSM 17836]|uniref:DUF3093 domain-containing protein n=1 Tax=Kribbella flavida (strain DSM 17836 / JCM 10339 / NBRC 14399) TaxID=479435 RepID=D2PP04_KRIFD|nr:DUF3093 domain-containing protein [Kribbella flavida]ADB32822.1 hypothetical protein Kfla_3768 [Kribbella flavida DSM 17836]